MACLIAAPSSGSGKTLLSLSLAALCRKRGLGLQTFKVGPDYLDPQLLSQVSGRPCRNLDTLLCPEEWVQRSFHWHSSQADLTLVEGVMGLFDGRGPSSEGSSAAIADLLQLPVVLVVEASRQAGSLAALVRGFRDHGPPQVALAGVVLNRVGSERHQALLSEALQAIEVPLLGVLPHHLSLALPSRHLGLLPPGELADLAERQEQWASLAEQHLDLEALLPLMAPAAARHPEHPISWCLSGLQPDPTLSTGSPTQSTLAIASDSAFHFRYPEAGELLEALGVEPIAWSPLADEPLPPGCQGVLLPGGYPELHAPQLAASRRSLKDLARAVRMGLPVLAECGGLLLLGQGLEDPDGTLHPMAGVLPFQAKKGALSLGYRQASADADGLVVRRGEQFVGHEFHRWQLAPVAKPIDAVANFEELWQLEGWGCSPRREGWTAPNVHASWLHLHWAGCPVIPSRLAAASRRCATLPTNGAS
ncbi:cobyrinate a,c-diamide synthase [Cyanobium sp. WAJ14-Wanaka]|uniref:cobyrinate a,c-diamide synthase n=1 Tax=Cyanobium sp. WAJ14-Wanaka TaxID=2823725 RepID=UPI0020CD8456|nr:cobyrinate a,c-diamide synthase [Cyanobium sp. WAJ14-Wanaka]MCP9774213.1 cobyrinate a,c-diamide synthase [Cyanobium sp. WAJ14-Wanaka]